MRIKDLSTPKNKQMTNPFRDQEKFMKACDQKTDAYAISQYKMYLNLIDEEHDELKQAVADDNVTEQLDALIDILVVTVGAIHSLGADGAGAWNEVMRTNFAKIDPATGRVNKREDGKVLKPRDGRLLNSTNLYKHDD